MNRLLLPAAFAAALISSPALADCATDIENVKTVTQNAALSDDDLAKIEAATAAATEKQAAGDEEGCMNDINTAKTLLKIE